MSIEELRAKVQAAVAGKLSSAYEGSGDYALWVEGIEIATVMQPLGGSGFLGGGPADENQANAALLVDGRNLAKRLCADEGVDAACQAHARAFLKTGGNTEEAMRAAIRVILGEGASTLGVGVEDE